MTNHGQIVAMRSIGFSHLAIAERLKCSLSDVMQATQNVETNYACIDSLLGTKYEYLMWRAHMDVMQSYERVAFSFGVDTIVVKQRLRELN